MRLEHRVDRNITSRRDQWLELAVLAVLYVLQSVNAEMLKAAIHHGRHSKGSDLMISHTLAVISDHVHPVAMVLCAILLAAMTMGLICKRRLPRLAFDVLGLWFTVRLGVEFLIINALIFRPLIVPPRVLLAQILVYLPFFVFAWGWIFQRLDWVGRQPGDVLLLSDIAAGQPISRFDYFHSSINTLLNKGKQSITGVNRTGRIVVLIYMIMILCLYAVAFTRILQLTKAMI
jgi:hypothetical protein